MVPLPSKAQPSCDRSEVRSAYLESLAGELTRRGLSARVLTPYGRVPSVHVVNPAATALAENVYAAGGADGVWWYWWSWAERIAVADDVDAAADCITRVLAAEST
jgi:hypothetical protein